MERDKGELIRQLHEATSVRDEVWDVLHVPGWDLSSWELLMSDAEPIELPDGELLLRRGEPSSDLYFLVKGTLEVSTPRTESNSMSPLISIGPGSVVGEIAFFDKHGRSASVWSRGRSDLLCLRQRTFEDFKQAYPLLACDLLFAIGRIVAERLRKTQGANLANTEAL